MGKKNVRQLKGKQRSFFNSRILIIIVALILIALIYFLMPRGREEWNVSDKGILSYPENRGKVHITMLKTEQHAGYTLADIFSSMGYASLGIEQRNRGGVDFRYDFDLWKNGKEPVEHKMVFEALRAVDLLRQQPSIDPEKIAIVGESNGGRFALIAAATDPKISGVIGISTSGYDTESQIGQIKDENVIKFYRSVDPETYLKSIPPRKFVMLHSVNDTIIQIQFARNTFEKANEPKKFYSVSTGTHGYSDGMKEPIINELKLIFG